VVATLRALNDEVTAGVDAEQLVAAYAVLEFVRDRIGEAGTRDLERATNDEVR